MGRRRNGVIFAILVVIVVVVVIVITVLTIITFVGNRTGLGSRGRRGLSSQTDDGGCGGRCISSRAAVSLAVLLEGLTLLHGVAAIIEELGVMFVLATDGKVTGVIVVIWLGGVLGCIHDRVGIGPLTSRISAIQPAGGVLRLERAAPLTTETAVRATRAKEANLNMASERERAKRMEGWRERNA